jgi:hypothetical protein
VTTRLQSLPNITLRSGKHVLFCKPILFPVKSIALAQATPYLRVLLSIDDPELRGANWEQLCGPFDGTWQPLALNQRVAFVHLVDSRVIRRFQRPGRNLRTLVVVASPADLGRYNLSPFAAQTFAEIAIPALQPNLQSLLIASTPNSTESPSLNTIYQRLTNEQYALLHLVCHARVRYDDGETILYLASEQNPEIVEPVTATRLIAQLALLPSNQGLPYMVLLSACDTASRQADAGMGSLGRRLVADLGIPIAIAMSQPVTVETAGLMSRAFYERLPIHGIPDRALVEASAAYFQRSDVFAPVIYTRLESLDLFASGATGSGQSTITARQLREVLTFEFTREELRILCADIDQDLREAGQRVRVTLDLVGGEQQDAQAQNLIDYLRRRGVLEFLIAAIERVRPGLLTTQ